MIDLSYMSVYFTFFFIAPLLFASRSYVWGHGEYAFINKRNLLAMKGFGIFLIIMQMICDGLQGLTLVTSFISKCGLLGGALFLFIAGYEMMGNYMSNRRQFKAFIVYQMKRLMSILLVCNFIGVFINIMLGGHDGIIDLLRQTLMFKFMSGNSAWLFGSLLYFYGMAYLFFPSRQRTKQIFFSSLFYLGLAWVMKWPFMMAFCFLGGMFISRNRKLAFKILRKNLIVYMPITLLLFLGTFLLYLKGSLIALCLIPYSFLLVILCVLMKLQCGARLFRFLGSLSIETYGFYELLHLMIKKHETTYFLLFWALLLIGSIFLKQIMKGVIKEKKLSY